METQTCIRCSEVLPLSEFALLKSGNRRKWCRACMKAYKAAWKKSPKGRASTKRDQQKNGAARKARWAEKNPERAKELQRKSEKAWREKNADRLNAKRRKRHKEQPEIHQAQQLVRAMCFFGMMYRLACQRCGAESTENKPTHPHHHDHWKPLDVEWFCCSCHAKEHLQ